MYVEDLKLSRLVSVRSSLGFMQIRPVDRKMHYQIQKLTNIGATATDAPGLSEKEPGKREKAEDLLKYRPNPDLLIPKTNGPSEVNIAMIQ